MIEIFKKILYLILVLGVNLYICSWLKVKILARSEMRRGFTRTSIKGFAYPVLKFFRYLGKDQKITVWDFLTFVFSFLLWSFLPLTSYLVIVDIDYSVLSVFGIYVFLIALYFSKAGDTAYGHIFSNMIKKYASVFSYLLPFLLSIAGMVLVSKTLSLKEMVNFQYQYYNVIYQPLGFLIALASVFFQMKVFDLADPSQLSFTENARPEGEGFGNLVMKLSHYFIIFFLILFMIIVYLGGWKDFYFIRGEIFLALKFYLIYVFLLLVNKATPRLDNYTYLSNINIRFLVPAAGVNFLVTLAFFILRNTYGII